MPGVESYGEAQFRPETSRLHGLPHQPHCPWQACPNRVDHMLRGERIPYNEAQYERNNIDGHPYTLPVGFIDPREAFECLRSSTTHTVDKAHTIHFLAVGYGFTQEEAQQAWQVWQEKMERGNWHRAEAEWCQWIGQLNAAMQKGRNKANAALDTNLSSCAAWYVRLDPDPKTNFLAVTLGILYCCYEGQLRAAVEAQREMEQQELARIKPAFLRGAGEAVTAVNPLAEATPPRGAPSGASESASLQRNSREISPIGHQANVVLTTTHTEGSDHAWHMMAGTDDSNQVNGKVVVCI